VAIGGPVHDRQHPAHNAVLRDHSRDRDDAGSGYLSSALAVTAYVIASATGEDNSALSERNVVRTLAPVAWPAQELDVVNRICTVFRERDFVVEVKILG
jgi:hypothetical protein